MHTYAADTIFKFAMFSTYSLKTCVCVCVCGKVGWCMHIIFYVNYFIDLNLENMFS